jgi:hypothetical protein
VSEKGVKLAAFNLPRHLADSNGEIGFANRSRTLTASPAVANGNRGSNRPSNLTIACQRSAATSTRFRGYSQRRKPFGAIISGLLCIASFLPEALHWK